MAFPDRRTASVLLTIRLFVLVLAVVYVARATSTIVQSAPAALAGFVLIPILAIFFLSDGGNLANQVIHLVSAKENHAALRSLADELHVMLQRYIRANVILGGLSLLYC